MRERKYSFGPIAITVIIFTLQAICWGLFFSLERAATEKEMSSFAHVLIIPMIAAILYFLLYSIITENSRKEFKIFVAVTWIIITMFIGITLISRQIPEGENVFSIIASFNDVIRYFVNFPVFLFLLAFLPLPIIILAGSNLKESTTATVQRGAEYKKLTRSKTDHAGMKEMDQSELVFSQKTSTSSKQTKPGKRIKTSKEPKTHKATPKNRHSSQKHGKREAPACSKSKRNNKKRKRKSSYHRRTKGKMKRKK